MRNDDESLIEESIEIDAAPAHVWALVHDVCRMPEWSAQVESTRLRAGFDRVALGAQFSNRNRHGDLDWITHAEVVRFEEGREIAFRIEENWVVWSLVVEPTAGGGTRLTQRREAPEGISELSHELAEALFGGQEAFTDRQRAGVQETLAAIRDAAEGTARAGAPSA